MVWVWGVILFVLLSIELFTFEFIAGWFSIGALVSFVLAICGVGWIVQTMVFVSLSLLLLFSLRKLCLKNFGYKFNEVNQNKENHDEKFDVE